MLFGALDTSYRRFAELVEIEVDVTGFALLFVETQPSPILEVEGKHPSFSAGLQSAPSFTVEVLAERKATPFQDRSDIQYAQLETSRYR